MPDNKENEHNINENKNHVKNTADPAPPIDGSVVLLWTVVIGALAMIIGGAIDERISVSAAGIVSVISGFIAITTVKLTPKTYAVIFLPIAGLPLTVIPIYSMLSEHDPVKYPPVSNTVKLIFWCALAVITGICMTAVSISGRVRLKKRCTLDVDMLCVEINEKISRKGIKCYISKWEYSANGQVYTHYETSPSRKSAPDVGQRQSVTANPDDPSEIYTHKEKGYLAFAFIGICLVFAGGLLLSYTRG